MRVVLRPYTDYKNADLVWLDRIPSQWRLQRAKNVFKAVDIRSETGEEELLTVSSNDGVVPRKQKKVTMFKAESYVGYKLCWPGDLVINSLWAWMRGLGFSKHHGIVSSAYGVYRPKLEFKPASGFLNYLLRSTAYDWELRVRSKGIWVSRLQLTDESFFDMPVVLPPIDEAERIGAFLDVQERRIRRLIRAKRREIELLNEQKQAIIHRAVTRGLDPKVRVKPSGIEWLGDVPESWTCAALRLRYSVELGKMLDAKRITGEYLIPYLRNTDVQWDRINTNNLPQMDIHPEEYNRYTVREGDLLVCEGGDVGRSAFWQGCRMVCGYQKALHRVRPHDPSRDCPRFLFYLMFAASKAGVFVADGSENTIAHLTCEKLRAHRFPFPPYHEQASISTYLDKVTNATEARIERVRGEIALLREYRARLFADVVTGKLDVRGVEVPKLEEVEQVDSLEGGSEEGLEQEDEAMAAGKGDDADNGYD